MKSSFFKYIFLLFVVIIIAFSVYKISNNKTETKGINQEEISDKGKTKELNLAISQLDNINPIISKNRNVQEISKLIFDPLINISDDFKLEGALATEWAKTADNTYIIKLREDVKWSNGNQFTADDVRFTIDRLKDTSSIYSYNVQYVTGVEVVDKNTIKIKLDRNVPFFEYNLTFPILSKEYFEGEDFVNTSKNKTIVGTGMYKISDAQDKIIVLEQNLNWWKKENLFLQKISINLYSSMGEVYNAFKLGSVDFISTSNANFQDYVGTIGYNYKEMKNREHTFIAFNMKNNALSEIEVRQAIASSIDKQNIVSGVLANKAYVVSYPLDYGSWLYNDLKLGYEYSTDNAKQLLVENGWNYKNTYWQKNIDGQYQKLSFNLVVKSSNSDGILIAENIRTQLDNQGIRINIIKANEEQYNNYLQNKSYDMLLSTTYMSVNPDLTTFFGESNLANYSNEETKKIVEELNNITDEKILKEKFSKLEEIYKNDIPYISICTGKTMALFSDSLTGNINSNWFNLYNNIKSWYK